MNINRICSTIQNVVDDKIPKILISKNQTFTSCGFDSFSLSSDSKLKEKLLSQLESLLKEQKNQNITGNIIDKIKCLFGYGSKKTQTCIQKLKDGNISLTKLEAYLKKYSKIQELPKEPITPEIEKQLKEYAKKLSIELNTLKNQSAKELENFVGFSESGKYCGKNNGLGDSYRKIKTRAKSEDSIFAKLKSKYEAGKLKLGNDEEANLKLIKEVIADGYGTRLQLKSVSAQDFEKVLFKHGIDKKSFEKKLALYIKNPNIKIEEHYLKALNDLKEIQTKDIFETLLNGIKNKSIEITEITNYGNRISAYFTDRQIGELIDAYNSTNPDKFLKITTQNASDITKKIQTSAETILSTEEIGDKILSHGEMLKLLEKKKFKTSNGKNLILEEIIQEKGSTKGSGYTSCHINIIQKLSQNKKDTLGFNEFQIRGSNVNIFGDVEHIPYDIIQGKITEKNLEYREIYEIIKNMSDKQYKKYNDYLTSVYNYLRLQELGINIGKMPELNLGKNFPNNKIDYQGLCQLKHS